VSFAANADSVTEPGKKSILATGIEGVTAEQLLGGIEKYIRDGKAKGEWASDVEVADKDGGILSTMSFPGGHKVMILYKIDKASNLVEIMTYPGPALYERGVFVSTCFLKVLTEPVQVEAWVISHPVRMSGGMLQALMDGALKGLDAQVETKMDAEGITDPSKFSVVSGPIEGKPVDADSFLDKYKQFQIDTNGATELPDGSLVIETSVAMGLVSTIYSKHEIKKGENCVYISSYGADDTMTDLQTVATLKAHRDPFRLEMWNDQVEARRAGDAELKVVQPLLEGVLKELSS